MELSFTIVNNDWVINAYLTSELNSKNIVYSELKFHRDLRGNMSESLI